MGQVRNNSVGTRPRQLSHKPPHLSNISRLTSKAPSPNTNSTMRNTAPYSALLLDSRSTHNNNNNNT